MNANLDAILAYQNDDVICRFLDQYNVTDAEALDIFQETKKFLYLTNFGRVFISGDLLIIDEMWHNFVLFTHEYQAFCQEYFGMFKHHMPSTKAEKEENKRRQEQDPEALTKEFMGRLEWLMGLTYDHLGAETVEKWFEQYPQKYGPRQIKDLLVQTEK